MKKLLFICAFLSIATTSVLAQTTDFRKGSWGDSKAEIMAREKEEDISSESNLYGFDGSIGGKECYVLYAFLDGKLFRGAYLFLATYSDGNEYIRDYNYFVDLLKMKYGEPLSDDKEWISESWKNYPDHYGHALKMGDVYYTTIWQNESEATQITLSMGKDDGNVMLKIVYDGLDLAADHQAKILEDL